MIKIKIIPREAFNQLQEMDIDKYAKMSLIADMCRANTLSAVKLAGSGHLGSSFSAMDIVSWLYYQEMNTLHEGIHSQNRDIYFSSKGHDVPGLYSILYSAGIIPKEKFLKLRRIDGLDGHPHISIPGIEANSGSLGMGISKAKGMAFAKNLLKRSGRLFVLTGDGELQEGQIYEALQSTVHQKLNNLNVIVDHNKVQSDKPVCEIIDLRDLETKFRAFGWYVERCDGHDFRQLEQVLARFREINDKPKILIADTIKGKGVSFMEHPNSLKDGNGLYQWHSGAPDDISFLTAQDELFTRIHHALSNKGLPSIAAQEISHEKKSSGVTSEYVSDAFGESLVHLAAERDDIVVLDADLAADCHLREFEKKYPDRFIENGIAEQDMVSMAGGLAIQGLLPVVNTFGAFLASRANEQIYNNTSENTRIIYVCHYAGLIPAGPGLSHQSLRDISLFSALPNTEIIQPANATETRMVVDYCINHAKGNCVIRVVIGPSPRHLNLPAGYRLRPGVGATLREGKDAVLFAYGPVMLHEALEAAEILENNGLTLTVINMPWLNRVDPSWLKGAVDAYSSVYVLEDHAIVGGLGNTILNKMAQLQMLDHRRFGIFGIQGMPAWGTPSEVLHFHGLSGPDLAKSIIKDHEVKA